MKNKEITHKTEQTDICRSLLKLFLTTLLAFTWLYPHFPPKGEISNCDRRKKKCLLSTWACRKSMADRLQTSLNGHIKDSGRWFWSMKRRWLRAAKYQWIRTVSLISFPDQACPGYARVLSSSKAFNTPEVCPPIYSSKGFHVYILCFTIKRAAKVCLLLHSELFLYLFGVSQLAWSQDQVLPVNCSRFYS